MKIFVVPQLGVIELMEDLWRFVKYKFTKVMDQPGNNGNLRLLLGELLRYVEVRERCNSLLNVSSEPEFHDSVNPVGRGNSSARGRGFR